MLSGFLTKKENNTQNYSKQSKKVYNFLDKNDEDKDVCFLFIKLTFPTRESTTTSLYIFFLSNENDNQNKKVHGHDKFNES